jgi:hypothetical protein
VNFINSPTEPANIPHNLLSNSDNPIKAANKAKQLTIINLDKPRKRWMVRWEGKLYQCVASCRPEAVRVTP